MGCDIHIVIEKKVEDKWITVAIPHWSRPARIRNYERFGCLSSGVRGNNSKNPPLGLPVDVSETAKYLSEDYGRDGHSHSWMSLEKAAKIYLDSDDFPPSDYYKTYPWSGYFDIEDEAGFKNGEYRMVFWFDN